MVSFKNSLTGQFANKPTRGYAVNSRTSQLADSDFF